MGGWAERREDVWGGALTRAPTEKERTGWRKYTPASLTRSLLHDKLKIKEKAFEEKAQGKPGMASALYDYGNKYTKAKVKAEEEKSRLGPAKYYAKKVTIGPLKTLFGANQDSLLGSMVIGAAYGSGLFKKKGAKKFKKKELLEQGFSEEEIESMKDKGWDIESDAEEKKKENGGEETKMPKNKSKTYMPE